MWMNRQIVLFSSATLLVVALATPAVAQSNDPGPSARGWGWGPGMMMGPGMMGPHGFSRMCGPAAAGFAEWRVARLERTVKPTDAQRPRFEDLKAASNKAAEIMRSACPSEFPPTVTGRMEVMEKRADAMLQAVKTVRPALDAFYATLSDEQKARVDSNTGRGRFWRWRDRW